MIKIVCCASKEREAFTIIEVLVSVVLISVVVLGIAKLQKDNRDIALYLSDRGKNELTNTLFMGKNTMKYHKEKKDAYALISSQFKISDTDSREVLKNASRQIFISEPIKLSDDTFPVKLNEIFLKGDYPARFYHFEMR